MVVAVLLAILWGIQLADSLDHYSLLRFGIAPRRLDRLGDIFSAPLLHVGWGHLADNTVPLAILGFIAALAGLIRFLGVSFVIVVVSGLGVWVTAAGGTDTVGASGLIFGYFGYLVVRGIFDRRLVDVGVGLVVGILYWSILAGALPGRAGVSWQAHLFGLLGGVLAAGVFHRRQRQKTAASPG